MTSHKRFYFRTIHFGNFSPEGDSKNNLRKGERKEIFGKVIYKPPKIFYTRLKKSFTMKCLNNSFNIHLKPLPSKDFIHFPSEIALN